MHIEELYQAVSDMAVVVSRLKEDADNAVYIQNQAAHQLSEKLASIDAVIKTALISHVEQLRENASFEIKQGSRDGIQEIKEQIKSLKVQIDNLKKEMQDFSSFAAIVENRFNKASTSLLMKIGVLSAIALVAVIASSLWLASYYGKIIHESKLSAEAMRLYAESDVRLCGKEICVKTKNTPQEFKKNGYLLIAPKK